MWRKSVDCDYEICDSWWNGKIEAGNDDEMKEKNGEDAAIPLKRILTDFLQHVSSMEAKRAAEGEGDQYTTEFQALKTFSDELKNRDGLFHISSFLIWPKNYYNFPRVDFFWQLLHFNFTYCLSHFAGPNHPTRIVDFVNNKNWFISYIFDEYMVNLTAAYFENPNCRPEKRKFGLITVYGVRYLVPLPPFLFVHPSPLFQWVRLGQEARGPSAAARIV